MHLTFVEVKRQNCMTEPHLTPCCLFRDGTVKRCPQNRSQHVAVAFTFTAFQCVSLCAPYTALCVLKVFVGVWHTKYITSNPFCGRFLPQLISWVTWVFLLRAISYDLGRSALRSFGHLCFHAPQLLFLIASFPLLLRGLYHKASWLLGHTQQRSSF